MNGAKIATKITPNTIVIPIMANGFFLRNLIILKILLSSFCLRFDENLILGPPYNRVIDIFTGTLV